MLLDMVNTGAGLIHPEAPMQRHERATIEPPLLRYAEDNPEFFVRAGGAAMPVTLLFGIGMYIKRVSALARRERARAVPAVVPYTEYADPVSTEPSDIPEGARVTQFPQPEPQPLRSPMMEWANAITGRD